MNYNLRNQDVLFTLDLYIFKANTFRTALHFLWEPRKKRIRDKT